MEKTLDDQQLYSLFNQTFQIIGVLGSDGVLIEANQSALDFVGVERSQVIGQPFWETPWWTHDPELQTWLRRAITRAAAGEFIRREVTHRHHTGEIIPFDFSLKPVFGKGGQVIYLIPEGRDIRDQAIVDTERQQLQQQLQTDLNALEQRVAERTVELTRANDTLQSEVIQRKLIEARLRHYAVERQQAVAALLKSEEQLRLALDLTHIGTWDWQIDTGAVTWNANHYRLWGYQPGEVEPSYQTWRDRVHPDDIAQVEQAIAYTLEHQTDYEAEYRVMLPDGSIRWILGKGQGIYTSSGQPMRNIGVVLDITDRKQADQKIREQAALLDISSDAIAVRDLENHILYWNQGAERLYGWSAAEAVGQNANQLLYNCPPPALAEAEVITSGEWQGELQQVTKAGREIIVNSRWTLARDKAGHPKFILVVNSDITEKKQLEAQFLRAQRLESIGTLAGGIAHDLNNLLTPIGLAAQLLQRKPLDAKSHELLEIMVNNARRGTDLVKQILTFARGTEGKRIPIQIDSLLSEITKLMRQTFPRSIQVRTSFGANLWLVSGDLTQLHQLLMNLCVNARDAMPAGGVLTVRVDNLWMDETYARMHQEASIGPYLVLTITDTGAGMTSKTLERIFDPFFTTKEGGTGLGLSTVIGIVKGHGGLITVTSEVGQGSQFRVYLPALQSKVAQNQGNQDLPSGNGETILVVDDEAEVRRVTQETLEAYNYQVITASNGPKAIALYAEHQQEIEFVLMNLMMPIMDGTVTALALRKINPQVRVILTSGSPLQEALAQAAKAEVASVLAKPYSASELLQLLHDLRS